MMIDTIVLASNNPHKTTELRALLEGLPVTLKDLSDFPGMPPVDEDGETLEDNAIKKALAAHVFTGLPSVADDTGLEVYYLLGAPGVYSARYAGEGATYADNVRKLLRTMTQVPARRRQACFRTVIATAGMGRPETFEGRVEGVITLEATGTNGFGYDPIFRPADLSRTYAELSIDEKNTLSHRARAMMQFRSWLAQHLKG